MRAEVEHACGRRWNMHAGGGGTGRRWNSVQREPMGGLNNRCAESLEYPTGVASAHRLFSLVES